MGETRIENILADLRAEGVLIVLKGIPLSTVGEEQAALDETVADKLKRLIALRDMPSAVIAFEEFVCLYDLLLLQYRQIHVIENPLYRVLYPVDVRLPKRVSDALLAHFDADADEDAKIGDIAEYTKVFGHFQMTDAGAACCYNLDASMLRHEKIIRHVLSFDGSLPPVTDALQEGYSYRNLCTEVDYFCLVERLRRTQERFAIAWDSFDAGRDALEPALRALNTAYPGRLLAYVPESVPVRSTLDPHVGELMKRYWGYASFRTLKVYDLDALRQGEKRTREISQADIVGDLIGQAERCIRHEAFRDLFVTAPTGAGKSLIFQLPAMYLAEKYGLVTLVITPLIGLMNDQVAELRRRGYTAARTINSDLSPVMKQEILDEVAAGACHILYLSPESLLSRSDVQQLIGLRKIGLLIVDEAHIVTTWGKQFRPDYWYLGDHVRKLRQAQFQREGQPFIISTFTATAIYEGREDMYHETLNSLHMVDPIVYLGYVRRKNIRIDVREAETLNNRTEYELNKFESLLSMMDKALMRGQKTLIYFPTVALINRFYDYCYAKGLSDQVARYHGQLSADEKEEGFRAFREGSRLVMIATKAFGMGIDIPDIAIVAHFAPTGNVCDYMQEIGRAARDVSIEGVAYYRHMRNDFQHINRLYGLSAIRRYQLIEIMKKVLDMYTRMRYQATGRLTRKSNGMLVDAESFGYIFDTGMDEGELINKVKTAMLLIQKDFENRGFAPFHVRPIPLFADGYFAMSPQDREQMNARFGEVVRLMDEKTNVCRVDLKRIWETSVSTRMSFPKFKYLLYSQSRELVWTARWTLMPAMAVDVSLEPGHADSFFRMTDALKAIVSESTMSGTYMPQEEMSRLLAQKTGVSRYRAESVLSVVLAAMNVYQREYARHMTSGFLKTRVARNDKTSYLFQSAVREFFAWLEQGRRRVLDETVNGKMYVVDDRSGNCCRETTTILGLLESLDVLRFQCLGGSNSQLYIYVNETKTLQMVRDRPEMYRNRLLDLIRERHEESVRMMTFLFQNGLTSEEIWDHLENYFLGMLTEPLRREHAAPSTG